MGVILAGLGLFIGVILIIGVPSLLKREPIIKRHFRDMGQDDFLSGTFDLALPFLSMSGTARTHQDCCGEQR